MRRGATRRTRCATRPDRCAADHEFLVLLHLVLQPHAPAPDSVRRVDEFGDDALEAGRARALEKPGALAVDVVRVLTRPSGSNRSAANRSFRARLLRVGDTGEVVSLQVQKVECLVDQLRGTGRQGFLQQAETRCSPFGADARTSPSRMALRAGVGDRFGDLRKPARPVLSLRLNRRTLPPSIRATMR